MFRFLVSNARALLLIPTFALAVLGAVHGLDVHALASCDLEDGGLANLVP